MVFSLTVGTLAALLAACAPQVAPETGLRLVQHESRANPYAIGVNGPYVVRPQPVTSAQAVARPSGCWRCRVCAPLTWAWA